MSVCLATIKNLFIKKTTTPINAHFKENFRYFKRLKHRFNEETKIELNFLSLKLLWAQISH